MRSAERRAWPFFRNALTVSSLFSEDSPRAKMLILGARKQPEIMGKARLSSVRLLMIVWPTFFCGQTSKTSCKVREVVHRRPPSLLTPASEFRVPKTLVRVDDIFEGCREFTENSYTHSYGLLQQTETLKSAKRIGTQTEARNPNVQLLVVLSQWSHGQHYSPRNNAL